MHEFDEPRWLVRRLYNGRQTASRVSCDEKERYWRFANGVAVICVSRQDALDFADLLIQTREDEDVDET